MAFASVEEYRQTWPAAKWTPWDALEKGTRVIDHHGRPGQISSRWEPKPERAHHCATCTCVNRIDSFGFYIVTLDVPLRVILQGDVVREVADVVSYIGELRPEE